jgi:hypothetical protein
MGSRHILTLPAGTVCTVRSCGYLRLNEDTPVNVQIQSASLTHTNGTHSLFEVSNSRTGKTAPGFCIIVCSANKLSNNNTVTCLTVTKAEVRIANWIYWILTDP